MFAIPVVEAAVDGGLAAMAADDGVAATTTTSRLRATMAERVMATVAGSGVAATTAGDGLGFRRWCGGNGGRQQLPTGSSNGACGGYLVC